MAEQNRPATEEEKPPAGWERIKAAMRAAGNFPSRNVANPPSLLGQLAALHREAVKDVNSTMHQVFFGQQAGSGEPGTPLVPTQMMVNQNLGTVSGYQDILSEAAARATPPQQKEKGVEK